MCRPSVHSDMAIRMENSRDNIDQQCSFIRVEVFAPEICAANLYKVNLIASGSPIINVIKQSLTDMDFCPYDIYIYRYVYG
jgi:hypothetical protein